MSAPRHVTDPDHIAHTSRDGDRQALNSRLKSTIAALGLTGRETEVVELLVMGYEGTALARKLHRSLTTVKTHLRHVFSKCGVKTRVQLMSMVMNQTIEELETEYELTAQTQARLPDALKRMAFHDSDPEWSKWARRQLLAMRSTEAHFPDPQPHPPKHN